MFSDVRLGYFSNNMPETTDTLFETNNKYCILTD